RVREDIREIQQRLGITTVVVTHDQDEALSISDRVAVMNGGRIEQYAAPLDLYRTPATTFVGGFVGATNTLTGSLDRNGSGSTVLVGGARVPVESSNLEASAASRDGDTISVRPEDVIVGGEGAPARVTRVIPRGHFTEMVLELGETSLRAYVDGDSVTTEGTVPIRFRRALVYRDGALL
uniref:TOBE domain-containing protein n=1 Tax=Lapillicoccus sp. TaxID=1909287 RepID=UPI003983ABDF